MKTLASIPLFFLAAALGSSPARAAVSVSFDASDSDIGAGLYDFILTGAPGNASLANYNSAVTITGWAAPGIGNDITLVSTLAPSAWNVTQNDSNNAKWILESTTAPNDVVDGRFEIQGTPNLHGSLSWQFAWPGDNTYTSSGLITIAVVPETETCGVIAAWLLVGLLALNRARGKPHLAWPR